MEVALLPITNAISFSEHNIPIKSKIVHVKATYYNVLADRNLGFSSLRELLYVAAKIRPLLVLLFLLQSSWLVDSRT